jgi:hypothetical protein
MGLVLEVDVRGLVSENVVLVSDVSFRVALLLFFVGN